MAKERARHDGPTSATLLAGRYAYDGELGTGSSGRVIGLVDRGGERRVGKILDANAGARAQWELDALLSVESPHLAVAVELLRVVDPLPAPFAIPRGSWVLVQRRAEGQRSGEVLASIEDLDRRGARLVDLVIGVARGLAAMHAAGLAHGDVKPDNVLAEGAHATLIDLGAAAPFGRGDAISGSLGFMSTEAREGERSPATDLHALGATVVAWITGQPPLADEPVALPPWVPLPLATLTRALLSGDASERPHDASRVLADLSGERETRRARARVPVVGMDVAIERLVAVLDERGWARVVGPRGSGRTRWIEEAVRTIQRREVREGSEPPTYVRAEALSAAPSRSALVHLAPSSATARDAARLVSEGRIAGATHRVVLESEDEDPNDDAPPLRVPSLDDDETRALLASTLGEPPTIALVRAVKEATGGLAGRVVRGLRSLEAMGLDPRRAADWSLLARTAEASPLPRDAALVHAIGVVLGGVITLDPSRALPSDLAGGARWLIREGLASVREDGSLALHGEEGSTLARDARARALDLAATLPLAGLSRAVLDAQSLGHEAADRAVASLSRPLRERGDPERVATTIARYLVVVPPRESEARATLIGMQAEALAAGGEIPRALAALDASRARGATLQLLSAELLRLSGRLDEATALASALPGHPEAEALIARAELSRDPRAAESRARALATSDVPAASARAHEVLGLVASSAEGCVSEARSGRRSAARIEPVHLRRAYEARLASVEARGLAQLGRLDEARALHRESARLATLSGDRLLEATFGVNAGLASLERGELAEALSALESGARIFVRLSRPRELARALANLANAWGVAGDDARARSLLDEADAALAHVDDAEASALVAIVKSEVLVRRGKLRAASLVLETVAPDLGTVGAIAVARVALVRASLGERELARRTLTERGLADDPLSDTELALARARIALDDADLDAGQRALRAATRHLDAGAVGFEPRVRTLALEIEIAEALGRRGDARAHLGRLRALVEPTLRGLAPELQAQFRRIPIVRRALAEGSLDARSHGRAAELALDALATLAREPRVEALDDQLAGLALEVSSAERAFVVEWGPGGPLVQARAGAARADASSRPSSSIVARALREPFVVSSDAIQEHDASSSVHALALRSVVAIEILPRSAQRARRVLVVDDPLRAEAFDPSVVSALRALVDVAGPLLAARLEVRRARARERKAERRGATAEADAQRLRAQIGDEAVDAFASFVHVDPATVQLVDEARRLASSDLPLLIVGESGVGKDLLARAIHRASPRRHEPFVAERGGALAGALSDAALFGHTRGAFTGAEGARKGLFELAHGGTLFLDGIEDLAPETQAKLLRILVDGEVRPLGASRARRIDVRVIATTRLSPHEAIERGVLREDFYYRVAGAVLSVPALRDRPLDLERLVDRTLARTGREIRVSSRAREALRARRWPGNVRELEHALTEAILRIDDDVLDVPALVGDELAGSPTTELPSLHAQRGALTRELVLETLDRHHGNRTHTAKALGLSRFGLQKILRRLLPQVPDDPPRRAK